MANLGEVFIPAEQQDADLGPVPEDTYKLRVTDADIKATKAGTGKIVKVTFEIEGPYFVGRLIFANFNYINQSEVAQLIGRAQLKELCEAVGITELKDTDQLIGKRCLTEVTIRPAQNGYRASNEASKFIGSTKKATAEPKEVKPTKQKEKPPVDDDDDIPF